MPKNCYTYIDFQSVLYTYSAISKGFTNMCLGYQNPLFSVEIGKVPCNKIYSYSCMGVCAFLSVVNLNSFLSVTQSIPVQVISVKKKYSIEQKYVNRELKFRHPYFVYVYIYIYSISQLLFVRGIVQQVFTLYFQDYTTRQLICYNVQAEAQTKES